MKTDAVYKKVMYFLIVAFVVLKGIFTFINNTDAKLNPDEQRNYNLAKSNLEGKGYVEYCDYKQRYQNRAFYSGFLIPVYAFFIKNNIDIKYFVYGTLIIAYLLFLWSVYYFFLLSKEFIKDEKVQLLSTLTYCLYPSILYYIGTIFCFENIAFALFVIFFYHLYQVLIRDKELNFKNSIIIVSAVVISAPIRNQMFAFYFAVLSLSFLYLVYKKYKKGDNTVFPFSILVILAFFGCFLIHIPVLKKNNKMFGHYFLSNQSGFELMQGHDSLARGSWRGNWSDTNSEYTKMSFKVIPNLKNLNEYEESKARKQYAINWMKQHPKEEIILTARKIAIYFLPQNYDGGLFGYAFYNPINLIIHLLFIAFVISRLYNYKKFEFKTLLLIIPVIASLGLSVLFFVGHRWRYYAEPFMILCTFIFIEEMMRRFRILKQPD